MNGFQSLAPSLDDPWSTVPYVRSCQFPLESDQNDCVAAEELASGLTAVLRGFRGGDAFHGIEAPAVTPNAKSSPPCRANSPSFGVSTKLHTLEEAGPCDCESGSSNKAPSQ